MSEETIDKLSNKDREAIDKIYWDIWDMYTKAGCSFGKNHKGLKAWVEHMLEMGKQGKEDGPKPAQ